MCLTVCDARYRKSRCSLGAGQPLTKRVLAGGLEQIRGERHECEPVIQAAARREAH